MHVLPVAGASHLLAPQRPLLQQVLEPLMLHDLATGTMPAYSRCSDQRSAATADWPHCYHSLSNPASLLVLLQVAELVLLPQLCCLHIAGLSTGLTAADAARSHHSGMCCCCRWRS